MPLFPKKQSDVAKKKLEHKLYIARERPDELFDLSACELREVPNGIFSLIKVLLKTQLLLQQNFIRNLNGGGKLSDLQGLRVLNLSENDIRELPDDIKVLVSLQVLNLSKNRICDIPASISRLHNLVYLDLEENNIGSIPSEVGRLRRMIELKLSGNPLKRLPRELCDLANLKLLTVPLNIEYPPKDICGRDTVGILKYLREDESQPYRPSLSDPGPVIVQTASDVDQPISVSNVDGFERRLREQQLRTQLFERHMMEEAQVQAKLSMRATESRKKVMGQLIEEQARLKADLEAVQHRREREQANLVASLRNAEDNAADLIKQLIAANEAARRREAAEEMADLKLLERPDASFRLRKQDILDAMHQMLMVTDKAYQDHMVARQSAAKNYVQDSVVDHALEQMLSARHEAQTKLISELALEEDSQKQAFSKLQMQQDSQAKRLRREIGLIEQELCRLTVAELERKAKQAEVNQRSLTDRRAELLALLEQLNWEHQKRQSELQKRLIEMEERRQADQRDYWLIQYQRLLERQPDETLPQLDDEVLWILKAANGMDFLPNFRHHRISYETLQSMTDEDLKRIGVFALGVRQAIQNVIIERLEGKLKKLNNQSAPAFSAPPLTEPSAPPEMEPSAPPTEIIARLETECCICQNSACSIIFLPCGHVCCCQLCSEKVSSCPLCRSSVNQHVKLQY